MQTLGAAVDGERRMRVYAYSMLSSARADGARLQAELQHARAEADALHMRLTELEVISLHRNAADSHESIPLSHGISDIADKGSPESTTRTIIEPPVADGHAPTPASTLSNTASLDDVRTHASHLRDEL